MAVDVEKLLLVTAVGVGGYLAYTEWWEPLRKQREAEAKAAALAAASGGKLSVKDALTNIGAKACQDVAALYKVPASSSAGACYLASKLATVATLVSTKLTIKAAEAAGHEIGKGGIEAAHLASKGASAVGHAVAKLKFWGLEGLSC